MVKNMSKYRKIATTISPFPLIKKPKGKMRYTMGMVYFDFTLEDRENGRFPSRLITFTIKPHQTLIKGTAYYLHLSPAFFVEMGNMMEFIKPPNEFLPSKRIKLLGNEWWKENYPTVYEEYKTKGLKPKRIIRYML